MHVSLVFNPTSIFAEIKLCFSLLSSVRRAPPRSLDRIGAAALIGAAPFGDRHGRGRSVFLNDEDAPL
jgi:hypothetical protein